MISEIARRSAGSECALASELLPGSSLTVRVYSVTHFISFSLDVRVTVCFLGLHVRPLVVAFGCGNYEITQNMKRSVVTQKKKRKKQPFFFQSRAIAFPFIMPSIYDSDCGWVKLLRSITYKCQPREAHFINLIAPLYQNLSWPPLGSEIQASKNEAQQ